MTPPDGERTRTTMKFVNLTGKPVTVETVVQMCLGCGVHVVPVGAPPVGCPTCGATRYREVPWVETFLAVNWGVPTVDYRMDYRLEGGVRIGYRCPVVLGLPKPVNGVGLIVSSEVATAMRDTTNDRNDLYTVDMDGATWTQRGVLESVPGLLYGGVASRG